MTDSTDRAWDSFTRVNAGQRFRKPSAAMGRALTEAIVAEAKIEPNMTVLDIASGSGEPAISVATAMNGTGRVIATDISPAPLKVAEQRASERGLTNIEFQPADVHKLPFAECTFDRALCRLGAMFFSDVPCAFTEIRRVLKPGGRFTLLAWGPMEQPYFETTIGTVLKLFPDLKPLISNVTMFRFGEPGAVSSELRKAGFDTVEEHTRDLAWNWPDTPEHLWEYFQEVTIPFRPLLQAVPADRRAEVDSAVLNELSKRYMDGEVRFDAKVVIASAIR